MDYLKNIQGAWDYIVENKWSVLFIVFAILVAYSIGQQMSQAKTREHFETRCEKEKHLYEDNKPCEACEEDKPKKQKKRTIASASCPDMPDMSKYVLKKNVPDLKDYIHKTLMPDMSKYMRRDYVKENYVLRRDCKDIVEDQDDWCDNDEEVMVVDTPVCPPKRKPVPACNEDLNEQASSNERTKPSKEQMKKYQDYLDKNKDNMDVSYTKLEDAFTGCNLKMCAINGAPDGLKPISNGH